jgi:hypothetical protein
MQEDFKTEEEIIEENFEEEEESFKSFSLDEFSEEVSVNSGIDSSSVKSVIQAFVQINLRNLKLR